MSKKIKVEKNSVQETLVLPLFGKAWAVRNYPDIFQDHDVQQIFKKARIRPKMKYVLDDDISVMGLVSQNEGIALMPEMMLRTAGFDLVAIPLDPPQHRTIGLATLPIKETTLLVRTFVAFCRGLKEWS